MSSSRLRRLATVFTTASLAAILLGTGSAVAATPGWDFTNKTLIPDTVSPGSDAGYGFTIVNGGKSNISQLFLTSNYPASYLSTSRGTSMCQLTPFLRCAFGALASGKTIDVVVAITTPGSGATFAPEFDLNGTGNTPDPGGNSHGDTKSYVPVTTLSANANFAGGFQVTGHEIQTDPVLTNSNKQSTKLTPPAGSIIGAVTVQDGITTFPGGGTDPCSSHACWGDWGKIDVKNGAVGPVKVTLTIKGIPSTTNPLSIGLWHDGTIIMTRCSSSTLPTVPNVECVTVTKTGGGNNTIFTIVGWLNHNGTLRGLNG